jgi:hypothetical protein
MHNEKLCGEPCIESKKNVKARLKKAKKNLKYLVEGLWSVDIDYKSRYEAIGAAYMDVARIENQLSSYDK